MSATGPSPQAWLGQLPLLLALALLPTSSADATTLLVPDQYPTIGEAIAASSPGDSVLIRPTTYFERVAIGHDLTLMGLGPNTILDGEGKTTASLVHVYDHARVQLIDLTLRNGAANWAGAILAEEDTELRLDKIEIRGNGGSCVNGRSGTGGVAADRLYAKGCKFIGNVGGAYGSGALAFAEGELLNCTFDGNVSTGHPMCGGGPGAATVIGDCLIERCHFEDNLGDGTLALELFGSSTLRDTEFTDHRVTSFSSIVVFVRGPTATFERCRFTWNENNGEPIIYAWSATLDLIGTTFENNTSDLVFATMIQSGGPVHMIDCVAAKNLTQTVLSTASSAIIEGCTFADLNGSSAGVWANGPLTVRRSIFARIRGGPAITCNPNVKNEIDCNDLWDNDIDYEGCDPGPNDIAADPLFCSPAGGDYRLNANSPCAPPNSPPECGLIGALGVGCGVLAVNETAPPGPEPRLAIRPNPVVHEAEFILRDVRPEAIVDLFDPAGRLIETLKPDAAGAVRWRPSRELPSGVYFAAVRGQDLEPVRFVLVR